jgi:hypothetical protein
VRSGVQGWRILRVGIGLGPWQLWQWGVRRSLRPQRRQHGFDLDVTGGDLCRIRISVLGQNQRIPLANGNRLQHGPPGGAHHIGQHFAQLDVHHLQGLLHM